MNQSLLIDHAAVRVDSSHGNMFTGLHIVMHIRDKPVEVEQASGEEWNCQPAGWEGIIRSDADR
jgi:hypothetical protein